MDSMQEKSQPGSTVPLTKDNINPDHYKFGNIEAIEAIKESMSGQEYLGYLKGSIFKYLWRWNSKHKDKEGQLDCLNKAKWFLTKLIESVEQSGEPIDRN